MCCRHCFRNSSKLHLATVPDERLDVCAERRRFPQHGRLAWDVEHVVGVLDILLENHVRMVAWIPCRQDGVEHRCSSLMGNGVANPALICGQHRIVVLRIRPDELGVRLIEFPENPLAIAVAESAVLPTRGADERLPALSGRIGGNRPSVLETHQIEDEPALVPGDERIGLYGVRVEHQKSSSSRSSKNPCGQRSTNSPVLSIRSGVALTSPSICSTKTTET